LVEPVEPVVLPVAVLVVLVPSTTIKVPTAAKPISPVEMPLMVAGMTGVCEGYARAGCATKVDTVAIDNAIDFTDIWAPGKVKSA